MDEFIASLFGAPPDYSNALTPQQAQQMQSNALTQGGIGALIALLGASGPQARPVSTQQALAGALGAGFGGYQSSFDNTLKQLLTAQQLGENKRKQERQSAFEKAIAAATTTSPVGTGLTQTGQGSQARMLADQTAAFGEEGTMATLGALQSNVNLPTESKIDFDKYLQAIALSGIDPIETAKLIAPKETKLTGSLGEFREAKRLGEIPETMSFEQFKGLGKGPLVQNILGGDKLTPGQESIDKKFADDYVAWRGGGGQDMTAQIAQLKPVIQALEAGQPITGIRVAVQPDLLLAITNPKALQSREQVEEVVQRNLRAVLGAQFTEKEGERLIARAYNPKLGPEENAKRLRRLFLQMSTAAEQKQSMVEYFDQNGTLRGFGGKMPSVQDFYKAMEGETPTLTLQDQAKAILEQRKKR
jgi:hypothetical protein